MKKIVIAVLAVFCVFMLANCAKPKPTKEQSITRLKAKMYDVDRKVHKIENMLAKKSAKTKKQKAKIAEIRKKLEPSKKDLEDLQARLDKLSTVTAEARNAFALSLEQGMNGLNSNIEKLLGAYQETQFEETQPQ